MATMISMSNVNASDITDSIKQKLEDEANAALKSEKAGSLAVGDNTNVKQNLNITENTIKNIQNMIETKLETYMAQTAKAQ